MTSIRGLLPDMEAGANYQNDPIVPVAPLPPAIIPPSDQQQPNIPVQPQTNVDPSNKFLPYLERNKQLAEMFHGAGNPFFDPNAAHKVDQLGTQASLASLFGEPDQAVSKYNELQALFADRNPQKPIQGYAPSDDRAISKEQLVKSAHQIGADSILNQASGVFGLLGNSANETLKNIKNLSEIHGQFAGQLAANKYAESVDSQKILSNMADVQAATSNQIADIYDKYAEEQQSIKKDIDKFTDQLKEASDIDPRHLFKDIGIGGSILAIIGVAAGGFSSGLRGGPNTAADMLNRAIDRDITAQIEKRNGLQSIVNNLKSKLGDSRVNAMTQSQLLQAYAIQKRTEISSQLDVLKNQYEGSNIGLTSNIAQTEFDIKTNLLKNELVNDMAKTAVSASNVYGDYAIQSAKLSQANRDQEFSPEKLASIGLTGAPVSKELGNKAIETKTRTDIVLNNLKRLRSMAEGGTEYFPTDKAKEASALAAAIQADIGNLENLGTMQKHDLEFIGRQIPADPTGIRTGAILRQIDEASKRLEESSAITINGSGLRLIDDNIQKRALKRVK